ncbi:MAG: phosphoglycerate dehydrogenase [Hyphomicrobium sp.]|nr:phosphoglycerate dehydrogenase [Hyphomicrobium sp.]PPC81225.1 MAG: phosphoglycerate dehydrogenase [Hyphomicrobium sp.]
MSTKTAPRVLISDDLSPAAIAIFKARGIDVDLKVGLSKDELEKIIGDYDGLAIRSATKVTPKVLDAASRLKVVGRAGIGVDNVDIKSATARGVIVMNTPFGNSITTAEHAISLMLALARQIPAADTSTRAGKWEKSKFLGVEVYNKTLGVIGCGNIGAIVADRALGLKMKVVAFDPYLSPERAVEVGVEKVDLDELLTRSDFITLHTPLTEKTKNILSAAALKKCRPEVRIINCARGGLIDEAALAEALKAGQVAGAAIDVFEVEPAKENPLFHAPNVICTPHLGASTGEAQENVALQVAEQMSDYLLKGAITNAVNFPSISAEEAPRLTPWVKLAEQLGSFAGQLTERAIRGIKLEYVGDVANLNVKPMTAAGLAGVLRPLLADVNMVSALVNAKDRGIVVEETKRTQEGIFESYVRLTVKTDEYERSVAGTVFSDGRPRIIQVRDINMDFELTPHMLFVRNTDRPGFIGRVGTVMGDAGVNIGTFNLGREKAGGDAICMLSLDDAVSDEILAKVTAIPNVVRVRRLRF